MCNKDALSEMLAYNSVRFIQVKNWKIGLVYYGIQLAVLIYVVVVTIVINQGYQKYDALSGGISVKMKGAASDLQGRIYDSNDLIIPPTEASAFFATTSFIRSPNQTRGICPGGDKDSEGCATGCPPGNYTVNGRLTGDKCQVGETYCQIKGWCPVELDNFTAVGVALENVENWTAFVKINIVFPNFDKAQRDNVPQKKPITGVNLWSLGQIVQETGFNWRDIRNDGAIILIGIQYECNLNIGIEKCDPKFTFTRLDKSVFSLGYNYRYTVKTTDHDGTERRDLYKVMGLRVMFYLYGRAGKYDTIQLLLTLGAGLALLSVSRIVCDFILQYMHPAKDAFAGSKFEGLALHESQEERDARKAQQPEDVVSSIRAGGGGTGGAHAATGSGGTAAAALAPTYQRI